ncbi:MAG TPA: hypothetical protein VFP26_00635 [Gemmatimonadaceae bacterium]|jgi:hypothetical protein|nr:hypothetical protein [Gemmatimonadaceae bacterium]
MAAPILQGGNMFALHRITRPALACTAFLIAACAKKDNAAADTSSTTASTTASTTSAAPAPANINLADVAGKWSMRAVPTSGKDTSATTYDLTATNNPSGWTLTFPGRKPMPVQVTVDGDSVVLTAAPYASVRRKGMQVSTVGVLRLQNGDLVGPTTAHYKTKSADSVLVLNVTGTRTR